MTLKPPVFQAAGRFEPVDYVASTGSTNDDLVAIARAGALAPRALVAGEQTAGKGRRGRTWEQPEGTGLSMSAWIPWSSRQTAFALPVCLGLAALDAVGDTVSAAASVGLKWPNDVVASDDGRKIGGLLSEAVTNGADLVGVVCGIGLNITWPGPEHAFSAEATCLSEIADTTPSTDAVGMAVLQAFDRRLTSLESGGLLPIMEEYRAKCLTIGQVVRVQGPQSELEGTVTDIGADGLLILKSPTGMHHLATGDVSRLRPQES